MIKLTMGTAINVALFLLLLGFGIKLYKQNNRLAKEIKTLSIKFADKVEGLRSFLPGKKSDILFADNKVGEKTILDFDADDLKKQTHLSSSFNAEDALYKNDEFEDNMESMNKLSTFLREK